MFYARICVAWPRHSEPMPICMDSKECSVWAQSGMELGHSICTWLWETKLLYARIYSASSITIWKHLQLFLIPDGQFRRGSCGLFSLIWFEEGYTESETSERKQNRPPFEVLGPWIQWPIGKHFTFSWELLPTWTLTLQFLRLTLEKTSLRTLYCYRFSYAISLKWL